MSDLNAGDIVAYAGQGLAEVQGLVEHRGAPMLSLKLLASGATVGIPPASVHKVVRPLLPRSEAERFVATLRSTDVEPDDRHGAYLTRDLMRVLAKGTFAEQVAMLHRLYGSRYKPSYGDRRRLAFLEVVIVPELAHVLGLDADALTQDLHAAHHAFDAGAPERPDEPPLERPSYSSPIAMPGLDYIGPFDVQSRELVIGEWTESTSDQPADVSPRYCTIVAAHPGTWHAFLQLDEDDLIGLVAVHADAVRDIETLSHDAADVAVLMVHGGAMAIIDRAVRDDPTYVDAARFPLFLNDVTEGRGCHCATGGDGAFVVRTATREGAAVFVTVVFD